MRVIDARSGEEIKIGQTVHYPDGEKLTLIDVDEGLLSASAFVETVSIDYVGVSVSPEDRRLVTRRQQIPLQVRFTHPSFFLQKVAFIPS